MAEPIRTAITTLILGIFPSLQIHCTLFWCVKRPKLLKRYFQWDSSEDFR